MKEHKGQEYDENYMMEAVMLHPKIKKELEDAKDDLDMAKETYREAKNYLEDIELKWSNTISEWAGFEPFENALKLTQTTGEKK